MVRWKSKLDICGINAGGTEGCDHFRNNHPNGGPCTYKESTGPGEEEEDSCDCSAFVEDPTSDVQDDPESVES